MDAVGYANFPKTVHVHARRTLRHKPRARQSATNDMSLPRPPKQIANSPAPIPPEIQSILDTAPPVIQRNFRLWCKAVAALDAAPNLKKRATARVWGRRLGVSVSTVYSKRCNFRKRGHIALVDKSFSPALWAGWPRKNLPPHTVAYFKQMASQKQMAGEDAIRAFRAQLRRWQAGDESAAIPGYSRAPVREKPPGWSNRNLARFLAPRVRLPAPTPPLLRILVTIRRQGQGLIFSARQTFPKPAPKPAASARSAGQPGGPRP